MKNFVRLSLMAGLFLSISFQARAFTSLYVFGDSISTTTNNTSGMPCYYGQRFSNGRVWVEDLAQMQGLTYDPKKNDSYFGNWSGCLATNLNKFAANDIGSSLVILWVNNADLFEAGVNDGNNINQWTADINQSQNNHFNIIANLYAKGVRTLVMPNGVDISKIPYFNADHYTNFISLMCADYNLAFTATLNRARTSFPGLTIYAPDFNSFFTNLLAYPANYGVINALYNGRSIDAVTLVGMKDPSYKTLQLNGPYDNYIFWDDTDPTAKVHYWMATIAQQLISPVQISGVTPLNGEDRVDMVNVPVGQNGLVLGSTNLSFGNWTTNAAFASTNMAQSVFVPVSVSISSTNLPEFAPLDVGPPPPPGGGSGGTNAVIVTSQFYKLSFPINWTWP